ncbi:PAS domain-containing protein [Desulfonema limicola]|uniref:PAS domain-containing protein n=1 Tax=Desulfonema limicola TaxID=45656 RepID=A0A975GFN7_9BACT|nr:PAS domain-containing protein [Desulfonema limicola]QTA79364.1 PAS domain-containing protein [Desulfonema limicola]
MDNHDLDLYWKTVVDTIQEGVMIVNPEGVIISINQAFEEITGYRQDEILGRPCSTLNCSSCELVRNEVSCHWCVMFKRGQLKKQKCSLIRKDGQAVNILKNASVLKDRKGEVIGAVETITDITDLIEKEAQIEIYKKELDSEDRFHGIIGFFITCCTFLLICFLPMRSTNLKLSKWPRISAILMSQHEYLRVMPGYYADFIRQQLFLCNHKNGQYQNFHHLKISLRIVRIHHSEYYG